MHAGTGGRAVVASASHGARAGAGLVPGTRADMPVCEEVRFQSAALAQGPCSRSPIAASLYPTVLIVIASYYVLFAATIGSVETVLLESIVMTLFVIAAVAGFKGSSWIIVAGLAVHGVRDAVHGHIIANPDVPAWWPAWCLAYDVGAAGALAWRLTRPYASVAGATA